MESLWQSLSAIPEFPCLSGDAKTDVLVIGGGLAGILTAYCLQKKGIDTMLVEKDRICSAVTAGTTAKKHSAAWSDLSQDLEILWGRTRPNVLCSLYPRGGDLKGIVPKRRVQAGRKG